MITIDAILALNPCYGRDQIASLLQRDPYEALCSIPHPDARWLLSQLMGADHRAEWATACARRAKEYAHSRAAAADAAAAARAAAWAAEAARADEADAAAAEAAAWDRLTVALFDAIEKELG